MSLWKLRVGAEAYYLAQVASGLDDYYSGQGESAGRWVGHAASSLGLDGEVSGEDLRAVLAGLAPGTGLTPNGDRLRVHPRRVPGFDLTFSVPKSVSVVYALGDPLVQAAVVEAGEAAVGEALAWLEREACHVRRGTNRRDAKVAGVEGWGTRRFPGAGFVAARFGHRTSRVGDPQLHWHVLVANLTRGPDGRWSALDGIGLYRSQRTAGVMFQAALRRGLSERLGVEWTAPVNDACEIAGVPQRIVRLFSKRRAEIEAELDRLGTSGSKAAEQAALATRHAKTVTDPVGIVAGWQVEAETAGWGPVELDTLLSATATARPEQIPVYVDGLVGVIGRRLVEHDATFTRHQVAQAVAAALPAGATAAEVDRLTAGVLAHPEIVTVNDPTSGPGTAGWEQRFSTRHLLAFEAELIDAIASGVASSTGSLTPREIADACAIASLGDDQRDAVERLCGQGNAVEVLIGRAGTGKTYTLAAVASAYRTAGWEVAGVAPSARAARELETAAGIVSFTVPRFDRHLADHRLAKNTLVVVDEAGMCGTVDLHHVVTTARRAGAKVILVGDHHQLPEVAAGGGLTAAVTALGDRVCELTTNRRQIEPWEVDALDQLRHGDVAAAWNAYVAHGHVRVGNDSDVVHTHAVDDWWDAHAAGGDALLLAGTRSQAHTLNGLARQRAGDADVLTGPELSVAGRVFRAGDRVLLCRNDPDQRTPAGAQVRVDNGMLGTITGVNPAAATVEVRLGSGLTVRLDRDYLAGGYLDHGYAMTIHKSQGATCDAVFVVGPAGLYREAAYVALSRARHGATLYATSRQVAELTDRDHARGLPLFGDIDDPGHDLLSALGHSGAKAFASTDDPDAGRIADLIHLDLATLQRRLGHAATAEARAKATGLTDPADQQAALERAWHARCRLAVAGRVRALDRDNVGTVTELHDAQGTAAVMFVAADGTRAMRILAWSALQPIDHPTPVALPGAAQRWLDQESARIDATAARWAAVLADSSVSPGDAADLRRAVETRRQRLAHQLHTDQPGWLTWWVGPRPADPAGAGVWDDTVARIAAWRDLHHVEPDQPGLGPQPDDPETRQSWQDAMASTLTQRTWLTTRPTHPEPPSTPMLSSGEIHERIAQLERLFADAPPDPRRILDDLTTGRISPPDLHAARTDAVTAQTDRARWILANWPYVVEHHELQRLADRHEPLTHWPKAVPPAVAAVLDRLAANLDPSTSAEHRTLAELRTALAGLDPGCRLRELTEQLVATDDRLARLQSQLATEADSERCGLLGSERDLLVAQQVSTRALVDAERHALRERRWKPNETDDLRSALVRRAATLYRLAVAERPEWVVGLLTDLDERGTLDQLASGQVRQLILEAATHRDWVLNRSGSYPNRLDHAASSVDRPTRADGAAIG